MNVAEEIRNRLGEEFTVTERNVDKNNGVTLNGYAIRKCGQNIAPTIYRNDDWSDEETIDNVVNMYKENTDPDGFSDLDVSNFESAEYIYSRAIPVLVNHDKNENMLAGVPHRSFLNMDIIYKIKVNSVGTVMISNEMTERAGLDLEKLHNSALLNLAESTYVQNIGVLLRSLCPTIPIDDDANMFVATTYDKLFGASAILLDDIMQQLHHNLESDVIFIIPSSIHEVIAVPNNDELGGELTNMIKDVNATELSPVDVLSDVAYRHYSDGRWEVVS